MREFGWAMLMDILFAITEVEFDFSEMHSMLLASLRSWKNIISIGDAPHEREAWMP